MKIFARDFEPKVPLTWIALLRILVGVMFLSTWLPNFLDGLYTPDGLLRFFSKDFPQSENPLVFYANFIEGVILPIRGVFAPFQLVAEFLMGLAILMGAFTPLASAAGIFFLLNTMLATFGHDWLWSYILPIGILAVTLFTHAGRTLGVDAYFVRRFSERSFWLW
jgi:thiosulfate dehydrogenase (quinone) large subunit